MPNTADLPRSLDLLAQRLISFAKFPKYSLERRVDIFLVPFLEPFVKMRAGREARLVAPEFPVLSDLRDMGPFADPRSDRLTRRTVNVDYLFRLSGGTGGPPEWLFLELKTDAASFDEDQADVYAIARLRGMQRLRTDIDFVLEKTDFEEKYDHLRRALPGPETDVEPIRIAYLAPGSLRQRVSKHVYPRTPAQRDALPKVEPARTVDDPLFFPLGELAAMPDALVPREFEPLWPTVKSLLAAIAP